MVPGEVAAAISGRTSMLMLSMGRGRAATRNNLFGRGRSRRPPRPLSAPRQDLPQLRAEYDRLQQERIAAFSEFAFEHPLRRLSGKKPFVGIEEKELGAFLAELEDER